MKKIAVTATCNSMLATAKRLAAKLKLPLVHHDDTSYPLLLAVTHERLELQERSGGNSKPIYVNFLAPNLNYRIKHGGGIKQLIAKAVGIKSGIRPSVLDATAGLGVDAFVLASLGCEVVMLERSPIIGALLQNGLERLMAQPQAKNVKIALHISQASDYINEISHRETSKPDVIYLDPMYPERQKAALGKKTLRILHTLVGADEDAAEVLKLALKCAKKRVVVKRPNYAPPLGSFKPDCQFAAGGSCRYDVYFSSATNKPRELCAPLDTHGSR